MEFTQVIENRYSCKNFSARQLAPAQLDASLAAGRVAPTATNQVCTVAGEDRRCHALPLRRTDLPCGSL